MAYYYLMSQLPSISPTAQQVPMSFEAFKELALRFLSKKDAKVLNQLSLEPPREDKSTGSKFLDKWYDYERALRLSLEQVRAAKLNRTSSVSAEERSILNRNADSAQVAKNAFAMENPLEAEIFLDNARFQKADTVAPSKGFSSDAVFAYGLKLMLRERATKFEMEKGRRAYTHTYNAILETTEN